MLRSVRPLLARPVARPLLRVPLSAVGALRPQLWVASFSSTPAAARVAKVPNEIDVKKLQVQKTAQPKPKVAFEKLVFGHTFTDHMLEVDWDSQNGWQAPRIVPFGNLSIPPAASSLHYALECFEGLKAYLDKSGKIRMFRPDMNMVRMNTSCARLFLPGFDGEQLLSCLRELLKLEKSWIPNQRGYSLYIRPTMISTEPFLGVGPANHAKLFVILSPVGPYYKEGFAPVKLYASTEYVRAWPGGTGNIKCGGNYALSIRPQMEAARLGYSQVMWLFGPECTVTEVGTMNQFFFWRRKSDGKRELITCPLDGTILPGVTRDSILSLARQWGEFEVTERHFTMHEVVEAIDEGRMIECFGAGTAAIVSPVEAIHFRGKEYPVPLDATEPKARVGKLCKRFADTILSIQYGETPSPWSIVVD